ncbi:hypothetical protein K503DRAFT_782642 [Rhizopogon vinicolor AM-OR11-026]|uniref:C2H2-type domain-containing protein n=1 Tax=Rhizopogon vinicolor AM-OR11-026 TaxID=1314800 RepID=A0A1B7N1N0_9AGAM|nr:hypothetical protein K503DRAFT_782642 [Rhizopogon vinicolor AM-OR11-026]
MTSTIYRRQSMATLYEKLRAQDGEDHMAWLAEVTAEFDTDDKPEHFVHSIPSPPSAISSASSSTTSSPQNPITALDLNDQSDLESDSDSDSEIEPIHNSDGILLQPYDAIQYSSSDFLARALDQVVDLPYIPPPVECHPPISLGYNTESQVPLPTADISTSPFVLQPSPPLRFVTRSTRSFSKRDTSALLHDLDEYVEGNSDAEETDDEYVPSSLNSRKRRSPRNSGGPAVGPSHQYASPSKRPRPAPLPRNVQAAPGTVPSPASKSNPWACPYCSWVQRNHRTPDLKRHVRTHTRFERPAQWVCCGIPFESATRYNVPHDATPYFRDEKQWIGGCGKEFSRRDALKRHLGNDHITCIGDIDAFANISDN